MKTNFSVRRNHRMTRSTRIGRPLISMILASKIFNGWLVEFGVERRFPAAAPLAGLCRTQRAGALDVWNFVIDNAAFALLFCSIHGSNCVVVPIHAATRPTSTTSGRR